MIDFKKGSDPINSIIGEGTTFEGNLDINGALFVSGTVKGNISSKGDVFINDKGKIFGNILAQKITISGEVFGDITSEVALEISKTGKIEGEIFCDKLLIEEGARYKGRVVVGKKEERSLDNRETIAEAYNA